MSTVQGNIIVPPKAPTVSAVRTVVRIRDVTFSDTSKLVNEVQIVSDVEPGKPISFKIDVPDDKLSDKVNLNLEVHIDLDGNGFFSPGDLVSLEPHRILADTREVNVPVSLV